MPFENTPRVIYKKNPLIEVVCQLRFPRILSINESSPVEFQERIRAKYPLFEVSTDYQQHFEVDATDEDIIPTPKVIQHEKIKNYKFSSADKIWSVNLTSTFLALSTSKYTSWEDFYARLFEPLKILNEIYAPAFFERVGLRYIDAFKRSSLGLDNENWNELIQPYALGFLSNQEIYGEVKSSTSIVEVDIGDGAMARINTLLGYIGEVDNGLNRANPEICFVVDSDIYTMKKENSELGDALNHLHGFSTKLIRSVITNKLHKAMEPETNEN